MSKRKPNLIINQLGLEIKYYRLLHLPCVWEAVGNMTHTDADELLVHVKF